MTRKGVCLPSQRVVLLSKGLFRWPPDTVTFFFFLVCVHGL